MSLRFTDEAELLRTCPELAARNAGKLGGRRPTGADAPTLPGITPPRELEAPFQRWFLDRARELGWRTAHFRTAQTAKGAHVTPVAGDGKGWPDNVCLRAGRLVVAELKADRGSLTAEQVDWLEAWRGIPGAEVFVWRPKDRPRIEEVLSW